MAGRYLTHLTALWILLSSYVTLTKQNEISVVQINVSSVITHRFSTTHVTSILLNEAEEAGEATFDLRLPKAAFITNFSITIDGEVYPGQIEEKEKARDIYNAAVQRGESAGYVRASPRQSTKFAVSVNVAAGQNVTFDLVYQELLQRRLGLYEHVIYIDPGQIVDDLVVEVYIVESRVITELSVPQITNDLLTDKIIDDTNEYAYIDMLSESSAYVSFWPTPEEQQRFSSQGVSGQFIINYDVEHESDGVGEILVSDGYFVHYFAPVWLQPMNKQIMFVMDTSGSMGGTKIGQMQEAMITILKDLSPEDEFGVVTFSSDVKLWKGGEMLLASDENIARGKDHASRLHARGGTNINSALRDGIDLLETDSRKAAMLIFLTDGEATSGETNSQRILDNISELNDGVSIFCLGFGLGADFDLLKRISAQNNGVARKIYEDADATLQLAGFYDEISAPLLSDLKIRYIGDAVDNSSLTETNLHCLFDGAEMVVAGKMSDYYTNYSLNNNTVWNNSTPIIDLFIEGNHIDNTLLIQDEIYLADTHIEDIPKLSPESIKDITQRLWVYLTIKQLIDTSLQSTSLEKVTEAKAKALDLSLKYGFVTPFTSMVVTKPSDDEDKMREVVGGQKPSPEIYEDSISSYQPSQTFNSPSYGISGPSGGQNSPGGSSGPQALPSLPPHRVAYRPMKKGSVFFRKRVRKPPSLRKIVRKPPSLRKIVRKPPSLRKIVKKGSVFFRKRVRKPSSLRKIVRKPSSHRTIVSSATQDLPYTTTPYYTTSRRTTTHAPTYASRTTTTTTTTTTTRPTVPKSTLPAAITIAVDVKHSTEKRVNLCFDIPESTTLQPTYSIIHSNIELIGSELSTYEDGKKFQKLLLKADNRTVEITTKGVKFDFSRTVGWWQLKFKKIVDGEILKDGSLKMYTGKNSSVTVNKHGISSRRSRAKPFLTLTVDILKEQLQNADGLLGNFFPVAKPSFRNAKKIVYGSMFSKVYEYKVRDDSCYRMTDIQTIIRLMNL